MSITFKSVRWKNFLSTGNVFTEIKLDKSPTTLIIGENGAGKSTMLDALCFGLFGRPFRNINKPQLVNSINEKGAVVEVSFLVNKKQVLVRRGIKPNIFEIEINDQQLEQNANVRDFQEILEKQILKLNYKSFTQIVVLGSSSFIPFMQLKSNDRKNIIEDLLDITIFSSMNIVLKKYFSENKIDIDKNNAEISILENKITVKKQYINDLKNKTKQLVENNQSKIDSNILQKNQLQKEVQDITKLVQEKLNLINDQQKIDKNIVKLDQYKQSILQKFSVEEKNVTFYSKHDDCPTCKQHIDDQFRESEIHKHETELKKYKEGLAQIEVETKKLRDRQSIIQSIQSEIQELQRDIQLKHNSMIAIDQFIDKIREDIEKLSLEDGDIKLESKELKNMNTEMVDLEERKQELLNRKHVQEHAKHILQDTGIKTKIIKQYLPIINKLINKYLTDLNFFCQFNLDENFNENIKSRFRDDFSYANFSEGEKQRIDLALLFTWRSVAKLKNSTNTNLLIMDEIFDSSLDGEGVENLMKILHTFDVNTNVFIISHKGDQLYDQFRSIIKFKKDKNFSVMA